MSDLAALRDLVELDLDDAGNATWSTAEIDRALKRALVEYARVSPQRAVGTITLEADGREISLSSLTGLTGVVRVWHPYTSADPEDPPEWRRFDVWGTTLYVLDGDEPASGDVVRVYYYKQHTIEDLESATSTTVPSQDEEVLVLGAGAYAAMQQARGAVGAAGVSTETPEHRLQWAVERMEAFHRALETVRHRELLRIDKRVPMFSEGWERADAREAI